MIYENTLSGIFEDRPNRFVAHVWVEGTLETVHVKNTGRCGELLHPGVPVVLQRAANPHRKTAYDLISVYKPNLGWVNLDSQVPNRVVLEWLQKQDYTLIKPEYSYGKSRLDFYLERGEEKILLEVKGCTLEMDGVGYFPDSKSARAKRHEEELTEALQQGYRCVTAFVIAMVGVDRVYPNVRQDPEFAAAFQRAREQGVEVWHFACRVAADRIEVASVFRECLHKAESP